VGSSSLGRLVWPGMVLAGLGLGLAVLAAWPEATTRTVRLPYGEAQPKTPRQPLVAAPAKTAGGPEAGVAPRDVTQASEPTVLEPEEADRVLAGVDPEPDAGPAPVPSEFELSGAYEQESPEELGAKPLPGVEPAVDVTPPPPAAG
jgi:hypothetical protein